MPHEDQGSGPPVTDDEQWFCVRAVDGNPPQAIALPATCDVQGCHLGQHWVQTGVDQMGPIEVCPSQQRPCSGDVLAVVDTCSTCHGQREKISASGGYWLNGRVIRTVGGQTVTNVRCHACRADDEPTGLLVSVCVTAEALPIVPDQRARDCTKRCVEVCTPTYVREWYWSAEHNQWQHRQIDISAEPGGTALILTPIPTVLSESTRQFPAAGSPVQVEWVTEQFGRITKRSS